MKMKPETIERCKRERAAAICDMRADAVTRFTETVARHEADGDHVQAAVFTELLIEAQDRMRGVVAYA